MSTSEDESSTSSDVMPQQLFEGRERRLKAGSKMAQLIQNFEDTDEFYKTTYGGFEEDESDVGFESPVESDSDSVDSDFDADETVVDEEVAEEEYEPSNKRQRRVVTKAYKEPEGRKPAAVPSSERQRKTKRESQLVSGTVSAAAAERQLRASTVKKSAHTEKSQQDLAVASEKPKRPYRVMGRHHLTQEQLLAEAKLTEELNLKSLERYQRYELEQKQKARLRKQKRIMGPFIRYHSVSMPDLEGEQDTKGMQGTLSQPSKVEARMSRTFYTFSDEATFAKFTTIESNPRSLHQGPPTLYCVVTGLPANYRDPITGLSFATAEAFKVIRQEYEKHVENNGNAVYDPDVAAWLTTRLPMTEAFAS